MARFKNISGRRLRLGRIEGPVVEPGHVVTAGDVTSEITDAWIVGAGDAARAWPKTVWELQPEPRATKTSKGDD